MVFDSFHKYLEKNISWDLVNANLEIIGLPFLLGSRGQGQMAVVSLVELLELLGCGRELRHQVSPELAIVKENSSAAGFPRDELLS